MIDVLMVIVVIGAIILGPAFLLIAVSAFSDRDVIAGSILGLIGASMVGMVAYAATSAETDARDACEQSGGTHVLSRGRSLCIDRSAIIVPEVRR